MKPIIAIPSYQRPNARILSRLASVPLDKLIFVRPEEKDLYSPWVEQGYKIVALPSSVKEIGDTRAKIVSYCSKKGIDWAFMFDDDISKVEKLIQKEDTWISNRIASEPEASPRFETDALLHWYKLAKRFTLSLSSPLYRPFARFGAGRHILINKQQTIQCVLINIEDILSVGNYKSTKEVGAEDMEIMYKLMANGKRTGVIGDIEYDCPTVGAGKGGNNAVENDDLVSRYSRYTNLFLDNVCNDRDLIKVKKTSGGVSSIGFIWKNWKGEVINYD